MAITWKQIERAQEELREERRIKLNVNYAVTFSLTTGEVHVLCAEVYEDSVREVFVKHGIEIASMHTYR